MWLPFRQNALITQDVSGVSCKLQPAYNVIFGAGADMWATKPIHATMQLSRSIYSGRVERQCLWQCYYGMRKWLSFSCMSTYPITLHSRAWFGSWCQGDFDGRYHLSRGMGGSPTLVWLCSTSSTSHQLQKCAKVHLTEVGSPPKKRSTPLCGR